MADFFIKRPIFAIVISLMIVILGIISAFQLPVAQYPQISPPTVSVSTTYTGANASVINDTVAQIIEDEVNGTQGLDYMRSSSDDTGSYSLSVKFDLGTGQRYGCGEGTEQCGCGQCQPSCRCAVRRGNHEEIIQ